MRKLIRVSLILLPIGGCVSVPQAQLTYYHPKAELVADIKQTALCVDKGSGNYDVYSASSVTLTPEYVADRGNSAEFDFSLLDGTFSMVKEP